MIVRKSPDAWLLISQVDHAVLAAEVAAAWRPDASLTGQLSEFAYAVKHHDDGWSEWEQSPTVDPEGRPRDFMEMSMPVATRIWSDSIDVAAGESPWCGLWVSRHFCHLAELAIDHRTDSADRSAASQFVLDQEQNHREWRIAIGGEAIADGNSPMETAGLHGLQFFDRLSLWLCCSEPTEALEIADGSGNATRWEPLDARTIQVRAHGLTVEELELSAPIVAVPRRKYSSDADLQSAVTDGERGFLSWKLVRATQALDAGSGDAAG